MKTGFEGALLAVLSQTGAVIKRDNAITPIATFGAVAGIVCFIAANTFSSFASMLISAGLFFLVAPVIAYFFFAVKDPNRLQSEKYQLTQARMQQSIIAKDVRDPISAEVLSPPITGHRRVRRVFPSDLFAALVDFQV